MSYAELAKELFKPEVMKALRDSAIVIVAFYLLYFVTMRMDTQIEEIETSLDESIDIQREILKEMEESNELHRTQYTRQML